MECLLIGFLPGFWPKYHRYAPILPELERACRLSARTTPRNQNDSAVGVTSPGESLL
jgi:hypothetical protein